MPSASDLLWEEMRGYFSDDAGYRPEFVLTGLSSDRVRKVFDRLVTGADVVDGAFIRAGAFLHLVFRDLPDALAPLESGEADELLLFVEGAVAGPSRLPPIKAGFRGRDIKVYWSDEELWNRDAFFAFVELILALQRELPGSDLVLQPGEDAEFILADREALRRYADSRG